MGLKTYLKGSPVINHIGYDWIMKRFAPALFLFLISPICGELLSGSAPPVEFFTPVTFITLCLLYGGGAVLVRETAFRWKKGWVSVLVLGAAYGIIEEGLMVKSFFDPAWMDLGILGTYGRWLEVNWVWTVELIIFHAIFSIGIPILITNLLFPTQKDLPWVSRGWLITIFVLFLLDVIFGFLAMTTYRPPAPQYLLAMAAAVGLICLARCLPDPVAGEPAGRSPSLFRFGSTGFIATLFFFMIAWVLPNLAIPPIMPILLFGILVWLGGWWVWRISGHGNWKSQQLAALASGALLFFMVLAPLTEMDQTRLDNPAGMGLVGLVGLILLFLFNRKLKRDAQNIQAREK
jgi:hypothetical protein